MMFLYLEVNSSFGFSLTLITIIDDGSFVSVKDKPTFVPFGSETFDGC